MAEPIFKQKILLVDDEQLIHRLLRRLLVDGEGYVLLDANNGLEGLEAVRANNDIGLIISDINMPQMTGYELVKAIRELGLATPIYVITGRGTDEEKQQAMTNGAQGIIKKPFKNEEIQGLLRLVFPENYSNPINSI